MSMFPAVIHFAWWTVIIHHICSAVFLTTNILKWCVEFKRKQHAPQPPPHFVRKSTEPSITSCKLNLSYIQQCCIGNVEYYQQIKQIKRKYVLFYSAEWIWKGISLLMNVQQSF